jgi:cellulose synthase/poly-beta-1,6-N-acetylglucosamine synthase-like glycosyltransferase
VRALFWIPVALLAWTQVGYGLFLAALRRVLRRGPRIAGPEGGTPMVALIVAAYREEAVIAAKVANALALDWPRDRLRVIVAVDGGADEGADATAERARAAGADHVLELSRLGKYRAQDAAVRAALDRSPGADGDVAGADLLAFSDANAIWERDALRRLAAAFSDSEVGYACGQVRFVHDPGTNQEGLYWRYDMWLRRHESALASVTAGNGAIYAIRPDAYARLDPTMGHDLALPFQVVKQGRRAVYAPDAVATEKMVPTLEGEWARKRRMMAYAWPIVAGGGLLDPRGYPPLYALMIGSHRLLRYASPLLHVLAAIATVALLCRGRTYVAAAAAQAAVLAGAAAGKRVRFRPFLVARYYVLTTAAVAVGLYDWLRHGAAVGWEAPEGTR